MTAFRYSMGFQKLPSYLNEERVSKIAEKKGVLLQLVKSLLSPPFNPTYNMLICDLANYYHNQHTISTPQKNEAFPNQVQSSTVSYTEDTTKVLNGVYREPKAVNNAPKKDIPSMGLSLDQFRSFVLTRLKELETNGR
jgi:hypothetical protein